PVVVLAVPAAGPVRVGADHAVEGENVRVPHRLDGLGVVADHRRVLADLGLGEDRSDLHGPIFMGRSSWLGAAPQLRLWGPPRSLGSTRSRRASPSMLKPKTPRLIAMPGKTAIHGAWIM